MRLWELKGLLGGDTRLVDVEAQLRCRACGKRGQAVVLVTVASDPDI